MRNLLSRRIITCAVLVTVALSFGSAFTECSPDQIAAVAAYHRTRAHSCHEAVDRYWPAGSRAWAHRIVDRESHGIATAANRRSSARGCFQLMLSVHARRFARLGYSTSQWSDPDVNVRVALDLYREAGPGPWRL